MTNTRLMLVPGLLLSLAMGVPALAQDGGGAVAPPVARAAGTIPADIADPLGDFNDYIHYTRIAQNDLALAHGKKFLDVELPPERLLVIVDDISVYSDSAGKTLERAEKQDGEVGKMAVAIGDKIQKARIALARDNDRIRQAIEMLDGTVRQRLLAQQRLNSAGEYAAPAMVATLTSNEPRDRALRPFVIESLVKIGRPVVAPLAEALLDLPAVAKQQTAEVLARIGYPLALPYLKQEIEEDGVDEATKAVLQTAFNTIIDRTGVAPTSTAADLYLALAEDYYAKKGSLTLDPEADVNLMWTHENASGLIPLPVPTAVFGDAQSMRAAKRALQLNADMAPAYSLWITANFRRENHLAPGQKDPSYPAKMGSAAFYATLAGPMHLHPALHRSLNDEDAELALDIIGALRSTANTKNLINSEGSVQPLIAAMNYPDRRVRYEAAFTLAESMPRVEFPGQGRVVPVLAEAVREQGKQIALVIAPSTSVAGKVNDKLAGAGKFELIAGESLDAAAEQIAAAPGIDLIIVQATPAEAQGAVAAARRGFKTMATPIIVLSEPGSIPTLNRTIGGDAGVWVAPVGIEADGFKAAVGQAAAWNTGKALNAEQAEAYATTAVRILREITIESDVDAFASTDAKPALVAALADERNAVVLGAASVLARFADKESQQAIADAAFTADAGSQKVSLLTALAESARTNGNHLTDVQIGRLSEVLKTATGDVADAAAGAHGALGLPTAAGVKLITE